MPTILQINTYDGGSTGSIARNINNIAEQKGWSAYLYYGRDSYHKSMAENTRIMGRGLSYKIRVLFHVFITRVFDKHGCGSCQDTKCLITEVERIKPDIIHLHNIHGYYLNYKVLFKYLRKSGVPVVWTLHDCWSMTGHCTHFEHVMCDRWKTGCYDCPEKKSYPASLFLDRSKKNYIEKQESFTSVENVTIVPVSNWLGNIVKESFLKDYEVNVINNGIDIQKFQPIQSDIREKFSISEKKIILGVASPWGRRKGLEDFFELHRHISGDEYQIVLIGLSEDQIKQLPKGIIGLTRTESVEELAQWYSAADVFVNPTYEDTYPTTNLEAISCGTPVATYRTGGSPESITSSTGRVVDKGDIAGFAKAIESLCRADRDETRRVCREYAVAHFDKRECFEKYIELYERILNKNK